MNWAFIDVKDGVPPQLLELPKPVKTEGEKFVFWLLVGLVALGIGRAWIGYPLIDERGFTGIRILRTVIAAAFDGLAGLSLAWALAKAWKMAKKS